MPNRAAKERKRERRNKNLAIKKFKRNKKISRLAKRRKKDGIHEKTS